jgi:hypothetical protein
MKSEDARKLARDMDDEGLAELHNTVQAEIRGRRPQVDQALLDKIKPGMSKEDDAHVRSVLQQAAKDFL